METFSNIIFSAAKPRPRHRAFVVVMDRFWKWCIGNVASTMLYRKCWTRCCVLCSSFRRSLCRDVVVLPMRCTTSRLRNVPKSINNPFKIYENASQMGPYSIPNQKKWDYGWFVGSRGATLAKGWKPRLRRSIKWINFGSHFLHKK